VSLDLRHVNHEDVREVWRIVLDHGMSREKADRFIAEGLPAPSKSSNLAIRAYDSLAKTAGVEVTGADTLSGPLDSETLPMLLEIGPFIVSTGLYRGATWVGTISDWGTGVDFNAVFDMWEGIKNQLVEAVPAQLEFDVARLAE
jgi:hypothetical protein